jgi:hypothetical protein
VWVLTAVDPAGAAAGLLQAGDRVLAINGWPPLVRGLGWASFMDLRPGERFPMRIARDGQEVEVSLPAPVVHDSRQLWFVQIPLLLISFSFFASGLVVGLLRPEDRVARLYAALALVVAVALLPYGVFVYQAWERPERMALAAARVLAPLVHPLALHFFVAFPPSPRRSRVWPPLVRVFYAWGAMLFPGAIVSAVSLSGDAPFAMRMITDNARFLLLNDAISSAFVPTTLLAALAAMVWNHLTIEDANERRRFRLLVTGSVISAAPFAAVFAASVMVPVVTRRAVAIDTWFRAQSVAQLFLIALPVTFAYAVLHHRVIGVDLVLRRSLRYLLARNVLAVAIVLPLVSLTLQVVRHPDRTVGQILGEQPLLVAFALISTIAVFFRDRLARWLDRRFFREAVDREQVLIRLVEKVRSIETPEDLGPIVTRSVEQALHPKTAHVFLTGLDSGWLRHLRPDVDAAATDTLLAEASLVQLLRGSAASRDVPLSEASADPRDADWLATLGARLIVPIGGGGERLHGVLVLGEKKSDEPYSREDRRLLEAVAAQIAVVCDNAALRGQAIRAARVERDVLAHLDTAGVDVVKECPVCGRCYGRAAARCDDDDAALDLSLPVPRTIQNRYRLDRRLGRGGMGVVYVASDLRLGRDVAMKLLTGKGLASDDARRRFDREARASARLHHPHIVTVHDYGAVGDIPFLVLERLIGTTLRAEISRVGAIPVPDVAAWFDQILDAVAFAHAAGVIHRDLKPENVFVSRNPAGLTHLTLLDFGLAKLAADAAVPTQLTEAGAMMGTLAYMAPEQLSGHPADGRADQFALGVMVIEALTGRHPFQRKESVATMRAILSDEARLDGTSGEVRHLDRVVQRSLAKDPAARFASVSDMRQALTSALRGCANGSRDRPSFGQ